jgi:hypothetical protein
MDIYKRVRELFDYDPATGDLIWKIKPAKKIIVGSVVGCINHGYKQVKFDNKIYRLHRVIWLWHYGEWPENEIDHINRIPLDNRIENLRVVTHLENSQNHSIHKDNTSGHTGIDWHKQRHKWQARIRINKKRISLGCYEHFEDACKAYDEAKRVYHIETPET